MTAIQAFLSDRYAEVRLDRQLGTAVAEYTARGNETLLADDAKLGFHFDYDFSAFDSLCILTVRGGRITRKENREDVRFGPGDTYSVGPPGEPHRGRVLHTQFRSVRLSPTLLSAVAGPQRYERGQPVRLKAHTPASVPLQRRLGSVVDHLYRHLEPEPGGYHPPLLVAAASHYLAAAVLTAFPSTAVIEPNAQDRRDARSITVRRACAYLEANATRPITLADIAEAARVTPRALQLAFRRHLGTTPMSHLRSVRLDLVHRALVETQPEPGVTAGRVAARFGFADYGRFTALYRRRFAESPVETLKH